MNLKKHIQIRKSKISKSLTVNAHTVVKLFSPQLQLEYGTAKFKLNYTHVRQLRMSL